MLRPSSRVAPAERREILGGAAVLALVMAAHALLETARDALFLGALSPDYLPWVYLAIAALAFVISWYQRRVSQSLGRREVFPTLLSLCAAVTCWFWLAAETAGARFFFVLYVWSGVFATLATIQFWLALSARYTITDAKRLFGYVGAGGITGAIVGSAAARAMAGRTETRHMLLTAAVCMAVAAPVGFWVLERRKAVPRPSEERWSFRDDLRSVRASSYLKRLSLLVVAATMASTFANFIFKRSVAEHVASQDLGVFFATTYLVVNLVGLAVQVLAVGWLLDRFGAPRAVCLLPLLLLAGGGAAAAGGGLIAALVIQGVDGSLKHSLYRTAVEVLYVPVPHKLRPAGKAVADVLGHRGGQAIASLAILGLLMVARELQPHAIALMLLSALAVLASLGLRSDYLGLFRKTLVENTMAESSAPLDKQSLEALFAALNSPRDERVLAALDLFAAHGKLHLVPALILHHPSPRVVLKCLEMFAALGDDTFVPVAMRLLSSSPPEVRAAVLRAITAVAPSSEALREAADDSTPEVRGTALVQLVASRRMAEARGSRELAELLEGADASVRAAVGRALAAAPAPALAPFLEALAKDEDATVRAEALEAIASARDRRFIGVLLNALGERRLREAARHALVAVGEPAFSALERALADETLPLGIRLHVPRSLSRFEAPRAAGVLLARLEHEPRESVKYKILRALGRLRHDHPGVVLDMEVLDRVTAETLRAGRALQGWSAALTVALKREPRLCTPTGELLRELIDEKIHEVVERIFRLLSLAGGPEDHRRIHRCLYSGSATVRAGALELLDSTVPERYRHAILGLVPAEPIEARLARLALDESPGLESALEEMIAAPSATVSAFAAYCAAELGLPALRGSIERISLTADDDWAGAIRTVRRMLIGSDEAAS